MKKVTIDDRLRNNFRLRHALSVICYRRNGSVPKSEELLRFLPGYQCFVVPVEHGRGMTQVQGSFGFLIVIQPVTGRCMSHDVTVPASNPRFITELIEPVPQISLALDTWQVLFMAWQHFTNATSSGFYGSFFPND